VSIVSVSGKNFCGFKKLTLPLKKQGLVWIGGENRDTQAAVSNAAGKSSLAKLIGWVPYGKTIDDSSPEGVIREGQAFASGQMVFDDGWRAVRVRREKGPSLRLYHNDEEVPLDRSEYQTTIDRLMGADWQTFRNTAFFGQRDTKRFIAPSTSDADRKKILHNILETSIYGHAHKWVRTETLKLQKEVEAFDAEIDKARARLEEHDLAGLVAQSRRWRAQGRERIEAELATSRRLVNEAAALLKECPSTVVIGKYRRQVKAYATTEQFLGDLEHELPGYESKAQELERLLSLAEVEADRKQEDLVRAEYLRSQLAGDHCPLCSSSLQRGEAKRHVKKLDAEVVAARVARDTALRDCKALGVKADHATGVVEAWRVQISTQRGRLKALDELRRSLNVIDATEEQARNMKLEAREALRRVKAIQAEPNPFREQIDAVQARIEAVEKVLAEARKDQERASLERAHFEFWVRGYGPQGLPSFALDSVMPLLTERANHYLEILADGDISLCFSTQRELRSSKGEFRDKISLSWEAEGVTDKAPSGGQWKKMEIACDFALMDLVSRMSEHKSDVLVLDEIFEGLDAEGVDRVGYLLQKLRAEHSSIFVISHAPTMQNFFEKALIVRKSGGVSRLLAA
jgi:DNA repair exonuclease SbcCD ATPase subunit